MPPLVAALPYIAVVATAVSTGVAVNAQVQAGQQAKKVADFKAKELQTQALLAQQEVGQEAAAKDQRAQMILSSIRANAAASGVDPSSGSALVTYKTSSEQAQLNAMYTRYAGNIQAQGYQSQAVLTTYGGKTAKQAAYYTAAGDAIAGVGSIGKTIAKNPSTFGIN